MPTLLQLQAEFDRAVARGDTLAARRIREAMHERRTAPARLEAAVDRLADVIRPVFGGPKAPANPHGDPDDDCDDDDDDAVARRPAARKTKTKGKVSKTEKASKKRPKKDAAHPKASDAPRAMRRLARVQDERLASERTEQIERALEAGMGHPRMYRGQSYNSETPEETVASHVGVRVQDLGRARQIAKRKVEAQADRLDLADQQSPSHLSRVTHDLVPGERPRGGLKAMKERAKASALASIEAREAYDPSVRSGPQAAAHEIDLVLGCPVVPRGGSR